MTEFAASVGAMTSATDSYLLKRLGIPESVLYRGASHVGVGLALLGDDGMYQPAPDEGLQVIVVPVGVEGEVGWDHLHDLVAFRPGETARWWRRTGNSVLLNPEGARRAEHFNELLPVWSSPLSWLQHGGQGVVVLDWSAYLPLYFVGVAAVACEDLPLAKRLLSALKEPAFDLPEVRVLKPVEYSYAA